MRYNSVATGVVLALVCLVLLGFMPIISNSRPVAIDALSFAVALSVWQTVFAAPPFFVERRYSRNPSRGGADSAKIRGRILLVIVATGAMFGLSTYLYVLGVEKAGATNAAIAMQAYPLFAILWETLFLKRRKTPVEMALTLALIATLYFLGTGGTLQMSGLSPWFLLTLCVPLLWSVAHVIIKEEFARTPVTPIQVTFFRVAISTVFLVGVLVLIDPAQSTDALGAAILQPMAVLMGLVYYVELIVWFYAVRHIDVSLASSITTPWPALTMALAAALLGDAIETYQIIALCIVVACIYGLTLSGLRKAAATARVG